MVQVRAIPLRSGSAPQYRLRATGELRDGPYDSSTTPSSATGAVHEYPRNKGLLASTNQNCFEASPLPDRRQQLKLASTIIHRHTHTHARTHHSSHHQMVALTTRVNDLEHHSKGKRRDPHRHCHPLPLSVRSLSLSVLVVRSLPRNALESLQLHAVTLQRPHLCLRTQVPCRLTSFYTSQPEKLISYTDRIPSNSLKGVLLPQLQW